MTHTPATRQESQTLTDKGVELFPGIEPFNTGTLQVSDLHTVFYEEVGNPGGKSAVFLHGGPGVGIKPQYRQFFDPEFYRLVLPDQRGAGRSTPHAELKENTTWELIDDLEKLRAHLKLEPWVVMGGSWGSTLALTYAITRPDAVRGIIIRGIFLGRPFEIDWLFKPGGAAEIFPDGWKKLIDPIPVGERDDLVAAYYQRLTSGDEAVMLAAARSWTTWEASMMNLIPDPAAVQDMINDASALSVGRTECHFTHNNFFMKSDNYILENADRIRNIPCRIVQGRYDVICPMRSAWDLHNALPESDLHIVPDGSHSPLDGGMISELVTAAEDFRTLF